MIFFSYQLSVISYQLFQLTVIISLGLTHSNQLATITYQKI
jgi:hypothetical protein